MERRRGSVWFVRFLRGTKSQKLIDLIGLSAFEGLGIAYSGHKGRAKAGTNTRTPVHKLRVHMAIPYNERSSCGGHGR